jgi:regulator of protease activity HflC (stomatin/prohibitin superfamily)
MFGINFIKFQPSTYVMLFQNGKVVKAGTGLSFFFYAPNTSLVSIPLGSIETPFIFEEVTADYQTITIQGQTTYRIADPAKLSGLLNFALDGSGRSYISEDPQKLSQRIVNAVQVLTRKQILHLGLRDTLKSADTIVENVMDGLQKNTEIVSLGLEILGMSILAIKPNVDTARALEAETREQILKEADDALYLRRNASVEQERKIKENELNTEIAVENKKRQILEAKMEADKSVQEKKHNLQAAEMSFSILQEEEKKKLVELASQNSNAQADAKAYTISTAMQAFNGVDPSVVQALASMGMKPEQLIALAFQGLAEKAEKIGSLNISPELLSSLLEKPK